jgi:hypothetical protein
MQPGDVAIWTEAIPARQADPADDNDNNSGSGGGASSAPEASQCLKPGFAG